MSFLFHEWKTKGSIRVAAEVLLLLPHNLSLQLWGWCWWRRKAVKFWVELMLMKKEGSQILGWTRAWLDPTISGLRLPQRPYWHQLALLPSRTFPPLKSSLIQKGKQHWWKEYGLPDRDLAQPSALQAPCFLWALLFIHEHGGQWCLMGLLENYTHHIYTKGLAQPLTLNVKSLVCPLKAALTKNLQY